MIIAITEMILPFDAHNHVHMGPTSPVQALLSVSDETNEASPSPTVAALSGMAIMSTHPRDYDRVMHLNRTLPDQVAGNVRIVPCFGTHPWFLHELTENDWEMNDDKSIDSSISCPKWIKHLEKQIMAHPDAIVGEIGLDGFHFDPQTKKLVSPMEKQIEAFRLQMELAARLQRPVSIHTVQCFGPLFDAISEMKKNGEKKKIPLLPPKMYFHAFGGKIGTIDQLLALCGKEPGKVYFGFAPVINFRSSKTSEVIRKIGIERLVLETDHEDASFVPESIQQCIRYLSEALEMEERYVIEKTTANAFELYGLN